MKRCFILPLVLLPLASCADRRADGPESELLPVCMLYPAYGYAEEDQRGDPTFLLGPDGSTDRTCACMTQEEFDDELRLDEFHEQALRECLELAAPFASNNCQDMYEEGGWLSLMLPALGDRAWLTDGKHLDCSEQGADEGCSTTGPSAPPVVVVLVLVVLCLGLGRGSRSPSMTNSSRAS